MDARLFWIGILPILLFVVLDSFTSKKTAILSATGMALAELVFTLVQYHTIDGLTVMAGVLAVGFGLLSYKLKNDLYFKLQAAIVGAMMGLAMLFYYYVLNEPLMHVAAQKYMGDKFYLLLEAKGWTRPLIDELLRRISRDFGWFLLAHAGVTAWTALRCNKWIWFTVRVPLLYALAFLMMQTEIYYLMR
ncbi:MAG: septation protein IspZ [Fibrobacterota bacterium]